MLASRVRAHADIGGKQGYWLKFDTDQIWKCIQASWNISIFHRLSNDFKEMTGSSDLGKELSSTVYQIFTIPVSLVIVR